jgi:hypothetical protein
MMMASADILFSFLLLLFVSCGSNREDIRERKSELPRYHAMAAQMYGQAAEFLFNDEKRAVLCLKKPKPTAQNPQQQVSFFVFDLSADSLVFEDEIVDGSVSWKDNFTVLVIALPGNVKSDEASPGQRSGYIFDLRTRRTRSLDAPRIQ